MMERVIAAFDSYYQLQRNARFPFGFRRMIIPTVTEPSIFVWENEREQSEICRCILQYSRDDVGSCKCSAAR